MYTAVWTRFDVYTCLCRVSHLVDVGPFTGHDVVFPLPRVDVTVGIRHLSSTHSFTICIASLVSCVHLRLNASGWTLR